jgi:mRNA-degrading endonuclease RelE of RelBE toxin-antitoxin system
MVQLTKTADKQLRRLQSAGTDVSDRIKGAIRTLALEPTGGKRLTGNLRGKWSYRAGRSYRIIYEIHGGDVFILTITPRRDAYR